MTHIAPTETPNVVVGNPQVRRIANIALGALGIIVGTAIVVDGSTPAFDITAITVPVFAGYAYVASLFQIAVTVPNIPSR